MLLLDINECLSGEHNCNNNNYCVNTVGGFECVCENGYKGDGTTCSKINHIIFVTVCLLSKNNRL